MPGRGCRGFLFLNIPLAAVTIAESPFRKESPMQPVIVHNFKKYNIVTDGYDYSRYKATAKAIEWFCCEPVKGTAETVDAALLDDLGRYKTPTPRP
jgi:hypothetical protein